MADIVECFYLFAEGQADWLEMHGLDFREAQRREPSRWTQIMPQGREIHDRRSESQWAKLRAIAGGQEPPPYQGPPVAEIDYANVRLRAQEARLAQGLADRRAAREQRSFPLAPLRKR